MPIEKSVTRVFDLDHEDVWRNVTHTPTLNRFNFQGVIGDLKTDPTSGRRYFEYHHHRTGAGKKWIVHWIPPDTPFTFARFSIGETESVWIYDFQLRPSDGATQLMYVERFEDFNDFVKEFQLEARLHSNYEEHCLTRMECIDYMLSRYRKHGLYDPSRTI